MMAAALNPKQLKFVAGIIAGLGAYDAYVKAGYKGQGKSGRNAASQLLANIGVQEAVQAHRARAAAATGATAEWSLAYLKVLAMYDGPRSSHLARVQAVKAILEHLKPAPAPNTATANVSVNVGPDLAGRIDRYEAAFAGAADRDEVQERCARPERA